VSIAEKDGVLDQVTDKGIILDGNRLSYSKWFEGNRPTEDDLGCRIRVVVDVGTKCSFVKRVVQIGAKVEGWKPPEPSQRGFGGGGVGRRFSPEELDLKREEGTRIARSVAIDRAISMVEKGIQIEKIADLASALEAYILTGELPLTAKAVKPEVPAEDRTVLPPSASPAKSAPIVHPESSRPPASAKEAAPKAGAKPKRLASQAINALFNEALRGGVVEDWADFLQIVEDVLKVKGRSPYQMDVPSYLRVEAVIRTKLGKSSAA
jgi:hypothetical protein